MEHTYEEWKRWTREHVKGCKRTALEIYEEEEVKYTVLDHEGFLDKEFGFLSEDSLAEDTNKTADTKPKKKRKKKQDNEVEPTEVIWIKGDLSPGQLDYFKMIFSNDFYTYLAEATNKNAENTFAKYRDRIGKWGEWKAATADEMKLFVGLLFLMGIIRVSQVTDYWLNHHLFHLSFHHFMTQQRFLLILRCLRFTTCEGLVDPLYEIRPLIHYFNTTMDTLYNHMGDLFNYERDRYGLKLCMAMTNHGIIQRLNVFEKSTDEERNKSIRSRSDVSSVDKNFCSRKKMGIHILHIMLSNAFQLYNKFTKVKTELYDYQLEVVEYLLPRRKEMPESFDLDIHLPEQLPKSETGKTMRKRCKYCMVKENVRKESIYGCRRCKGLPGFCLTPCFRLYHKYI